jgi:hypothetical protein
MQGDAMRCDAMRLVTARRKHRFAYCCVMAGTYFEVTALALRKYATIPRGRWCNIIVLNVHAPTEDKIDDIKDRFYEELEQVFDKLPKYHMKILLGDFNAEVGKGKVK